MNRPEDRVDEPGAVQYIIIRGIERRNIFRDTIDKDTFIEGFGKVVIQEIGDNREILTNYKRLVGWEAMMLGCLIRQTEGGLSEIGGLRGGESGRWCPGDTPMK